MASFEIAIAMFGTNTQGDPEAAGDERLQLADCCRIFRHDVVLVKYRISLVASNENARSGPMQLAGQVG